MHHINIEHIERLADHGIDVAELLRPVLVNYMARGCQDTLLDVLSYVQPRDEALRDNMQAELDEIYAELKHLLPKPDRSEEMLDQAQRRRDMQSVRRVLA